MGTQKFVECPHPPCNGKLIPIEELAEHSRWHSEQESKIENSSIQEELDLPPIIKKGKGNKPKGSHAPLDFRTDNKPFPQSKNSNTGIIIFAVILISVGLAFMLGIAKYWPLILIILGLAAIIKIIFRIFSKDK
jgi:hypothetical protein